MIPYLLIVAAAVLWFWPEIASQLPERKKPEPLAKKAIKTAKKKKEPARNERHK